MKVLLMGDASNYHRCLSTALAKAGHQVTVASHGSGWMQTVRDIDISRRSGRIGGALLWLKLNTVLASKLKGYDVVQIHNPIFVNLRPHRVRKLFERLRRDNGAVFLTALGTDPQYVDNAQCRGQRAEDRGENAEFMEAPLRYTEFAVGDTPTPYVVQHPNIINEWLAPELADYSKHVYEHIDGAVCALYEYYVSCQRHLPSDKLAYAGIPVDTASMKYTPIDADIDKVHFVVACHKGREAEKGIDRLLPVIEALVRNHPDKATFDLIQNVPFEQFKTRLAAAHVVVDQLYSYTPATTALMAMASGKVVVSGAEPEYYRFIGEDNLRPIINADPTDLDDLYRQLEHIIDDKGEIARRSRQGHEFVLKHNDSTVVAQRFMAFWERRLR